jgi:two-component system response regulator AtoC
LKEFSQKFDKQVFGISSDALAVLESYKWKGNIRELRNVMERIVLLIEENEVKEHHLSSLINSSSKNEKEDDNFVLKIPTKGIRIDLVLKTLILKTLKITNGNQVKAAKILGLSRSKLRYRMEQLGIEVTKSVQ